MTINDVETLGIEKWLKCIGGSLERREGRLLQLRYRLYRLRLRTGYGLTSEPGGFLPREALKLMTSSEGRILCHGSR